MVAPDLPTEEQRDTYHRKSMKPIQLKVLKYLRDWIKLFWVDFESNPDLLAALQALLDDFVTEHGRRQSQRAGYGPQ